MKKLIVLLDADDTLLDFKMTEKVAISATLKKFDIKDSDDIVSDYVKINKLCWIMLENKLITREYLDKLRFDILFEKYGIKDKDSREAGAYYRKMLSQGTHLIEGCKDFLEKLKKDYALYLVTNGTKPTQLLRIDGAGIAEYFDDMFFSEQIGYSKPYVQFFDYVFANIEDFDKEKTVIVGDSLSSDIKGANNAGIKSIWFNRFCEKCPSDICPDYETDNYNGVLDILKNIADNIN